MIPFSPPHIDEEIINEVSNALRSGWITTGPRTKKFEQEIANYCEIESVLAVNSWTAGAELVLRWWGIGPGDEVIVPAYTYCATANIVVHCGAKPVMVDIGPDFCMNIEQVKSKITPQTKAIIPVDIAGLPCDYIRLQEIITSPEIQAMFLPANAHQEMLGRILILSDAAHSFGAKYLNKATGSLCDITVFSFHAVKNLTTAEGGAIAIHLPSPFDNQAVYKELNILSLHGQTKDALAKTQIGNWEYDVIDAGYKCNMTDILASIGLIEIGRYNSKILPKRKEIFNSYSDAFQSDAMFETPIGQDETRESSYHLYLLRVKYATLEQRNLIIQEIFENRVSVNVHYKPLPLLTAYLNRGYNLTDFPISKQYWETEISLPIYFDLTEEQVQTIIHVVKKSVHKIMGE